MSTPRDDDWPGRHLAFSVVHPGSPVLRVRYRHGVLIGPYGYPDWALVARAMVELPPPDPRLTRDETRVLDVLAANAAMTQAAGSGDGDPLWPAGPSGPSARAVATPPGWCWAHVGPTEASGSPRRLALVPAELHGAFRHAGGASLLPENGRGLRYESADRSAANLTASDAVPDDVISLVEQLLGWPLPPAYRRFLATTNGAGPDSPLVCAEHGFVADQPLFGLAREDQQQDVSYAAAWLRDRFTMDFLPIGYVQGGILAVKVAGGDTDSIWYWDDDDPRDRERFGPKEICEALLHRCADSIDTLWATLAPPPAWLLEYAGHWVQGGMVRQVRDPVLGAGLPPRWRAPWMSAPRPGADPVTALFEAA